MEAEPLKSLPLQNQHGIQEGRTRGPGDGNRKLSPPRSSHNEYFQKNGLEQKDNHSPYQEHDGKTESIE